VVLFHQGRKWLRLLDTATLDVYAVPHAERRHLRPANARPKALARRLAKRGADWRRYLQAGPAGGDPLASGARRCVMK
jgi:hypothetical protein